MPNSKPSAPIQVASAALVLGGAYRAYLYVSAYLSPGFTLDTASAKGMMNEIVFWGTVAFALIYILLGVELYREKRMAKKITMVLMLISLGLNLFTFLMMGAMRWDGFAMAIIVLIALFLDKKNNKTSTQ